MAAGTAERWLKGSFSVLDGIRPYKRSWLSSDIVAGITLAALAIPEVMGYTKIAGTPVITGLYTILIPIAAFALFGSSRHLVVGGDSATAAIMYAGIAGLGVAGSQPATPRVARAREAERAARGGLPVPRAGRAPRLPLELPLSDRARRLPDRRRHPGRDRPGRRHARRAGPGRLDDALSGALRKLGLTLWHIGEGSWQTALVSATVLAILIVFSR